MDAVGWDVTFEEERHCRGECEVRFAEKWIGVVGVTVGLPSGLERAARTIADRSRCVDKPQSRGSSWAETHSLTIPELVAQVGADAGRI